MNKRPKDIQEETLSKFIDDLSHEKKPRKPLASSPESEQELLELFESVRAVKRLKGSVYPMAESKAEKKPLLLSTLYRMRRIIAAACVLIIAAAVIGLLPLTNKPYNVVYAMMEAYEKVETVSGVLEYTDETNGQIRYSDTITFQFRKPNKFYAVHDTQEGTYTKIYDGGKNMYILGGKGPGVTVEPMDPEWEKQQLKFLLLTNITEDLQSYPESQEPKKVGKEVIAGKETEGYEFTFNFNGNITIQTVWVSRELNLPLKWEIYYPGFTTEEGKKVEDQKITTWFKEIEINPVIDDEVFTYKETDK